jgi:hypothetical protein
MKERHEGRFGGVPRSSKAINRSDDGRPVIKLKVFMNVEAML